MTPFDSFTLEKQLSGPARELHPYFLDETVSDILINGLRGAYIERAGELSSIANPFESLESLHGFVERLLVPAGRTLDARFPYVDGCLLDGSRFHIIFPPAAPQGPYISIRKFRREETIPLEAFGDPGVIALLTRHLLDKRNLLIAGGTGAGKTTFLGLLISRMPPETRWVFAEETREIRSSAVHVLSLEARPPSADGAGEITLRQLVKNALRMRPDRLVVGECRGAEAFDMLQAMSVGHGGTLGTIHASSALDALHRFETLVGMGQGSLDSRRVREWIARAVHAVVFLRRGEQGRREIAEVARLEGVEGDRFRILPLFPAL